jgi:protein gp37
VEAAAQDLRLLDRRPVPREGRDEWIDRVFAVMALCPQHVFQVLTKRPERMREYFAASGKYRDDEGVSRERECLISDAVNRLHGSWRKGPIGPLWNASFRDHRLGSCQRGLPLPNVWLGTSTEDQARADERIPHLLASPAAVRFLSAEPLLGPIDLTNLRRYNPRGKPWIDGLRGLVTRGDYLARSPNECSFNTSVRCIPPELPGLDWVIAGGESGPGARPMHPDWARSLRDQCAAAGVPFFFKQWGEWAPGVNAKLPVLRTERTADWSDGKWLFSAITPKQAEELHCDDEPLLYRLGKKGAGRWLDGQLHDGFPAVQHG